MGARCNSKHYLLRHINISIDLKENELKEVVRKISSSEIILMKTG